jgi:hypothetical protein
MNDANCLTAFMAVGFCTLGAACTQPVCTPTTGG